MDKSDIKEALREVMRESEMAEIINRHVKAAVAEAMAAKDAEIQELRDELEETKIKLNELEQYSRRPCLNVSGVPETANEDTNQLVTDLAKMAGVNVSPGDIDVSHRIGAPRQGKVRAIIVRFAHYPIRQALYNARRELRKPRPFHGSTVSAETANGVFISDSLTRENQQTLYRARQLKKDNKIFAAWSDVGRLKIRISQGGPTHVIRSERDLTKLVDGESAGAAPAATQPETSVKTRRSARGKGTQGQGGSKGGQSSAA